MVLIAACDGLAPQNKPTSWSEGEARLEIVEKQGDLEVQPEVQRHLSALKGKEVLHDVLAVQEEIIEETFKFYNDITMPFFLDTDLQAVEGQPNQRSLPTWSSTTVSLRYSICTDAEDAANAIQAHRDCLLSGGLSLNIIAPPAAPRCRQYNRAPSSSSAALGLLGRSSSL